MQNFLVLSAQEFLTTELVSHNQMDLCLDCISIDGQQDDTSQSSSSSLKPKNQRKRKTNDEGDQNVSGTMQAVADSNFIPQSKKPRGSRKSADKDTSSKRGPGRPVTTGESSMETINLSIQAAIERYQGIKSATEYLLEASTEIPQQKELHIICSVVVGKKLLEQND